MSKLVWSKLWKCWLIPDPQNAAFSIRVEPQPPAPLNEEKDMTTHKKGCPATGGYGHGAEECICGADTPSDDDLVKRLRFDNELEPLGDPVADGALKALCSILNEAADRIEQLVFESRHYSEGWDTALDIAAKYLKRIEELERELVFERRCRHEAEQVLMRYVQLDTERDEAQAKIDRLMLEYCPDEMTTAQIENWAKHQKPVSTEDEAGRMK